MAGTADLTILIAAALIEDGVGRLLLVRKVGTRWFMQAGAKIEVGESPLAALRPEPTSSWKPRYSIFERVTFR